jgi:hypothetical protein
MIEQAARIVKIIEASDGRVIGVDENGRRFATIRGTNFWQPEASAGGSNLPRAVNSVETPIAPVSEPKSRRRFPRRDR